MEQYANHAMEMVEFFGKVTYLKLDSMRKYIFNFDQYGNWVILSSLTFMPMRNVHFYRKGPF